MTTKKKITLLITLTCVFALITVNVMAAEGEITYDKNRRLLTIYADMASYKAILRDVESKTGIKITIRGGIADKYVKLNIKHLPVNRLDDLLDHLHLNNTALIYDQKGNISEIIILPEGKASSRMHRRR